MAIKSVTIVDGASGIPSCRSALEAAIGNNVASWFAWVNDEAYIKADVGTRLSADMKTLTTHITFRNDASYNYYRNVGSGTCVIPAGTIINYVVLPLTE